MQIKEVWSVNCLLGWKTKWRPYVSRILNTFTNKLTHTNITKSEHLAFENVRKDKDCIIVTADKGMFLVVMDKTEYISKCEALPQDNSVYQHLSKDTSPTIHKEPIKILQDYKNNNLISETEYTQLRPHGSNSPTTRFYGLPKIYKNNMPMCPIVSACGTAIYNTAKFIIKILQNYCGKTSSFVKDSTDLIKKIKHLVTFSILLSICDLGVGLNLKQRQRQDTNGFSLNFIYWL